MPADLSTERLELQINTELLERLRQFAHLQQRSLEDFVVTALRAALPPDAGFKSGGQAGPCTHDGVASTRGPEKPNETTRAAMAESRVMMARKRSGFATAEALFNDLEKTAASKRRPLPGSSHYA